MIRAANAMRWVGGIGIVAVAIMRCAIVFSAQLVFETDPATDLVPLAGLAMGGSLWLDAALVVACVIALVGERLAGVRISWWMLLLAFVPWTVLFFAHSGDVANIWRGSTWGAAMLAAVTLAHIARQRELRIVLASILVSVTAYIAVRGVGQITFEHEQTVREFEQIKDKFLAERGWSPDSAAARIFERRLRQPEPTGWFPTTNIFGSLMAFGLVAWAGWSIGAWRARLQGGWIVSMALLSIGCATMLYLTGSKGAVLAGAFGFALAAMPMVFDPLRRLFERWGSILWVSAIGLALAVIVVRGTLLPESFAGDRSLLFRWHYLVSSGRMFAANALTGVGPDGYQDAYTLFRVPRNPEEVQSAHSMFADWLSTLGIVGICWVALTCMLAWRSGAALRQTSDPEELPKSQDSLRPAIFACMAVVVLGFIPSMMVEWAVMDEASLRVRCIGMLAFVLATLVTSGTLARIDLRLANWALAAAAITVLVHGQIEMTFHYGGSVVWAMCVLGVAGARDCRAVKQTPTGIRVPLQIAIAAMGGLVAFALAKGVFLAGFGDGMLAIRAAELQVKADGAAVDREARVNVAASLQKNAFTLAKEDYRVALAAAQQFMLAAEQCDKSRRIELLTQSIEVLEAAMDRFDRQSVIVAAIGAHVRLAAITSNAAQWNRAIELATEVTRRDPQGISSWRNLGDVLWAAGRSEPAADAYQHALQNNANFELDELKQLSDRDRSIIEARIAQARNPQEGRSSP